MVSMNRELPAKRRPTSRSAKRRMRAYKLAGGKETVLNSLEFLRASDPDLKKLSPQQWAKYKEKEFKAIVRYYKNNRFGPES